MTIIHGFRLIRAQEIKELNTRAAFFRHLKTGAELLSLSNDDKNKVFGITFRTPPFDSTGIAHILEHSVLCGSRKYPVKEPFVELLKGSLHTFLNAFTYPDKTCYPVASQNLQDFYNLIDVYLDAVFYPRLTPFIYQQEGWHYEIEKSGGKGRPLGEITRNSDLSSLVLSFKGVVFNEMKGAYSSPENVLAEQSLRSLFPDNPYGFDSGGDPKEIPDLTFEKFLSFHRNYYHPSNARIYFYGDDELDKRLEFMDQCLKDFEPIDVVSVIPLQPFFNKPKRIVRSFMAGEEKDDNLKAMLTVNWLLSETTDIKENFSLRILEYILLGMPASPLRKALIDSGLGEDLAGEGLDNDLRQTFFSTGLKGIQMEHVDRVESVVMETLAELVQNGLDPDTVEAALNTIEFRFRENNTGSFPRGLSLMLRSLTTWLYDADPMGLLAFETSVNSIKSHVETSNGFFEEMIDRFFLKNPHRTTLILRPDPGLQKRDESEEKDRLDRARSAMDLSRLNRVIENINQLKKIQETPDPPEALAAIPVLKLVDLGRKNKTIPLERLGNHGTPILLHDLFTNGVAYLDVGLNLHTLSEKYLPYVPLLGRSFVEMGTEKEDFISLTQRISRKTGGIRSRYFTSAVKNSKKGAAWLFLCCKAMLSKTEDLTEILHDIFLDLKLDNKERFQQMVLEEKARVEKSLIPGGHQIVNLRLSSHFGEAHRAAEQMGGISYVFFLRKLIQDVKENWPSVLEVLEDIRHTLVNRENMIVNVTLDGENWTRFEPQVNGLINALPMAPFPEIEWSMENPVLFEGMTIPSQVNYVGKGANLYELGYRFHGSILVITRYLRNSWLWDRVRVQGGAYGAFCLFDHLSGVLSFLSYRDPNLMNTLDVFDRTARFLFDMELSDQELTRGIIGAIGAIDAPMLSDAMGYQSMLRYITGVSDKTRQRIRDEILGTAVSDFKAFSEILEQMNQKGVVKVLGSSGAIEMAVAGQPGWLTELKVL